jgi:two-component system sensor histidine kinase VicK
MMLWGFILIDIVIALVAVYFSYKYEKERDKDRVLAQTVDSERKLEKDREDYTDMMVHELRAPLTAIRGGAALILSNMLPPPERDKMPRIILESANDMLSTVADFLDIAKIDAGRFELAKTKAGLIKVIEDHLEIFSYPAKEKNITINFDKNAQVPEFFFDQARVGQVVNNLISNSIKFTNEGGRIDVKIEPTTSEIQVVVTDNGIGIADSKKPLLFTKFGQINHAEGHGPSSGLGLYISKEIITAHGGKIWLESEEGKGTVAHFTLPIVIEEAPQQPSEPEVQPQTPPRATIAN